MSDETTVEQIAGIIRKRHNEWMIGPMVSEDEWTAQLAREIAALPAMRTPLSDANDLDAVVHALGIEDSDTTPAEAVAELQAEIERLRSSIARLVAALRPFAEWSSGLPSKTSAAVKMYAACVNAVAALADAPDAGP